MGGPRNNAELSCRSISTSLELSRHKQWVLWTAAHAKGGICMAQQALEANNLLAMCTVAYLIALQLLGTTRARSLELQFNHRMTSDALPGSLPLCFQQGSVLQLVTL